MIALQFKAGVLPFEIVLEHAAVHVHVTGCSHPRAVFSCVCFFDATDKPIFLHTFSEHVCNVVFLDINNEQFEADGCSQALGTKQHMFS